MIYVCWRKPVYDGKEHRVICLGNIVIGFFNGWFHIGRKSNSGHMIKSISRVHSYLWGRNIKTGPYLDEQDAQQLKKLGERK